MNSANEQIIKLRNLLREFSTAMLVTHAGGDLRVRPMVIADVDDDCRLWFLTGAESVKAHEIEQDTRVNVVCQRDYSCYISVGGEASLVQDRGRIADVWKESFRPWFPDGRSDPHIVLIEVVPHEAEYWDNEGVKKIRNMLETARAYVTGEPPPVVEGEQHGRIKL
jgi:general stress protein 26